MAGWNGSGLFVRLHNWVSDRDGAINITATRHDGEDDNLSDGINNCLTIDGQNIATADLPMNTQKHTGVGDAAALDDYSAAGQVQKGEFNYSADTGAADAYVVTLAPAATAYTAGMPVRFIATNANTGASTIDVNGLGAKSIKLQGNSDDPAAGDIGANQVIELFYDGTVFQIPGTPATVDTVLVLDKAAWPTIAIGTDTDHDIDIAAGSMPDSTHVSVLTGTAMTKQIDATWAAGTAAGGLFTGTVAADTTYHIFMIEKDSDSSIDYGFDTSVSAANIPAGYTKYRRIHSLLTNSSANFIGFYQHGDLISYDVPVRDVATSSPGTSANTPTVTVPSLSAAASVLGVFDLELVYSGTGELYASPTTIPDTATSSANRMCQVTTNGQLAQVMANIPTIASQIRYRASAGTSTVNIRTYGYTDTRIA